MTMTMISRLSKYRTPIVLAILVVSFLHMMGPLLHEHDQHHQHHHEQHELDVSHTDHTTTAVSTVSSQQEEEQERRWCMLTKDTIKFPNKWIKTIEHFPHTLEWYADCWTWLQEQTQFSGGAEVKGGFIVDAYIYKKLQKKYWNRAFFPAMEFPVRIYNSTATDEPPLPAEHLIFTKTYTGTGWFQRSDSCASFRKRLWTNLDVHPKKINSKNNKRRIGIINRNESRAIINIPGLVKAIQENYNDDNDNNERELQIDIRTFDSEYELLKKSDTLQEQAKWFARQDLIIIAHGAALSNTIFMRPGTAILELFPRYYFNDMFWDLMDQCGVYHSWYYDGNNKQNIMEHDDDDGKYTQTAAQKETDDEWDHRMKNKKRNINTKRKVVLHQTIKLLLDSVDTAQ